MKSQIPNATSDWFSKFSELAKHASDEDMWNLWAKVLAGEICQPGKSSLRLLHTISMLRKAEAHRFALFCNYVWRDIHNKEFAIINEDALKWVTDQHGMDWRAIQSLRNLGLINPMNSVMSPEVTTSHLCYAGRAYHVTFGIVPKPPILVELSEMGDELSGLCDPKPDWTYINTLSMNYIKPVSLPVWPWPEVVQSRDTEKESSDRRQDILWVANGFFIKVVHRVQRVGAASNFNTHEPCFCWFMACSSASYRVLVCHIFQRIFNQRWPRQRNAQAWLLPFSRCAR